MERYKQSSIAAALKEKRRRMEELDRVQNEKEKVRRERLAEVYERGSNSKVRKRHPQVALQAVGGPYDENARPPSHKGEVGAKRAPDSRDRSMGSRGLSSIPDRPPIKPILAPRVAVIGNEKRDLYSLPPPMSRGNTGPSAIKSPQAVRNRMKENYEHIDPQNHGFDVRSQQQLDRRIAAAPSEKQLRQEIKRNPVSGRHVVQEVFKPPSSQMQQHELVKPSWWG